MLIDSTQEEETRVVVIDGNKLEEAEFETCHRKQIKGNIYLAKVMRVEPSLQACFVDYGGNKHGFLAFGEIHPDYYNLPQEQIDAIDKEVNEIIEAKKQALKDREAERERIRAEKAAAYAKKLEEQAKAEELAKAQALEEEKSLQSEQSTSSADAQADITTQESADEPQISENQTLCEDVEQKESDTGNVLVDAHTEENTLASETTLSQQEAVEQPLPAKTEKKTRRKKTPAQKLEEAEEKITDEEIAAEVEEAGKKHPLKKRAAKKRIRKKKEELKVLAEESVLQEDKVQDDDAADTEAENEQNTYNIKNSTSSFCQDDNDDFENEQDDDDDDDELEIDFELQRKLLRARKLYHSSKIQDVIKEGQILLIQVVKEERGNKGAALTTYLSLAGRYCVLMPNRIKSGGVSRKITNVSDRKRLKAIVKELPLTTDMSLIVRTAGEEKTKADIVRDYNYLIRSWNLIRLAALKNKAPCMIHEEGNLIKRALRDIYTKDISEVLVAGEEGFQTAKNFVRILSPHNVKKIKLYRNDDMPLFQRFQVEAQLDKLHEATAQLESGGYLVINPTEALVSIDVNSGRATKEKDLEETALKTNLEACDEIARQLRLRNLAGLVVVDFIDMEDPANNHAVEKRMKEALKKDRSRIQVAKMSCFGLLEISRQRMHSSFMESNYQVCPYCQGQGMIRTLESSTIFVLRGIEEEGIRNRSSQINVFVPDNIAVHILNHKRQTLLNLEQKYNMNIIISADNSIKNINDYRIEKVKSIQQNDDAQKNNLPADEFEDDNADIIENDEDFTSQAEENENGGLTRRERRRRDRRDRRNRRGRDRRRNNPDYAFEQSKKDANVEDSVDDEQNASETKAEETETKSKKVAWWKKLIKS